MNQRQRRRLANYTAAMLISMAMSQGWGISQEDIDTLGLSDEDVQQIEDEVNNIRRELLNRIGVSGGRFPTAVETLGGSLAGRDRPNASTGGSGLDDRTFQPADTRGRKYAVCPGWITSENDGDRHYVDFGSLVRLYGVNPRECLLIPPDMQDSALPPYVEELIWLHPQRHGRRYNEMREELARGDDAFKVD